MKPRYLRAPAPPSKLHPNQEAETSSMSMQFKVTVDVSVGGAGDSASKSAEVQAPEAGGKYIPDVASKIAEAVVGAVGKAVKDVNALISGGDKDKPEQSENPTEQPGTPDVPPAPSAPSTEEPAPQKPEAPAPGEGAGATPPPAAKPVKAATSK